MKRYLIFSYPEYYPIGGWGDFIIDFNTYDELLVNGSGIKFSSDTTEIIDTITNVHYNVSGPTDVTGIIEKFKQL